MSYLRYLCLFVYSGVQHILCFKFFILLPVSLDCPFLIALSVFSKVYLHISLYQWINVSIFIFNN